MNLQKLYDRVFEKAQKFGELSPSNLSCQEAMEIIRMAQAAQQSVGPTAPRIKAGDDFGYMLSQQIKSDTPCAKCGGRKVHKADCEDEIAFA
jgi:hypothetical protein